MKEHRCQSKTQNLCLDNVKALNFFLFYTEGDSVDIVTFVCKSQVFLSSCTVSKASEIA